MTDTTAVNEGHCRYRIEGEMTIFRAAELKNELLDNISQHGEVEVDLSGVTEIDTSGLQLMVMAKVEAELKNRDLRFTGHSRPVLEILDMCDLAAFFGDPVVISSQAAG